jgi:hypothetical protein
MKRSISLESRSFKLGILRIWMSVLAFCAIGSQTIARADVISDWNAIGVTACLTAGRGPASYVDLAYMQLAVYDAVNAIDGEYSVFAVSPSTVPAGASQEAAAVAAAYRVLIALFPSQNIFLDAQYATSLAAIPNGQSKTDGIAVGEETAALFLASRVGDGRNAPIIYTPGSGPGAWVPTPPAFLPPSHPWMAKMRPFGIPSASSFRTEGPPALTSPEYAADFNEVKSLGAINSTTRTAEQTEIGLFYTDPGPAQTGRCFRQLAMEQGMDLADNARLFGALYASLADSAIASFEAKYYYGFWRPITAIRAADTDGNPDTEVDPTWTPLVSTPNHPDYVSTHSATWGGFSEALRQFFGTKRINITQTSVVTGTTHNFTSTDDVNKEIIDARVYVGIHTRTADVHGVLMGKRIAKYIAKHYFQPK